MDSYHVVVVGKAEYLWNQYLYTDSGVANDLAWALSTAGSSYARRGEHDAAIESCELAVRVLRDRIDQGTGTQQDESDLPLLLSNLAGAHGDAHHPAANLAAMTEAVERQRRVQAAGHDEDDDWVLAVMLNGYADAAMGLGFGSEARSSLRQAEDLLARIFERRPLAAKEILDQIETLRMRLPADDG